MSHVVYSPAEGDNREVTVFGLTFTAGKPAKVPADVFTRLSVNPTFKVAETADEPAEPAKVDGRSKAARALREEEAKARAAAHAAEVEAAKSADKDD